MRRQIRTLTTTEKADSPDIFGVYSLPKRKKYPSVLFITVRGRRGKHEQAHELSLQKQKSFHLGNQISENRDYVERITSTIVHQLDSGLRYFPFSCNSIRGSLVLSFSMNGEYIACACADSVMFPIKVYQVSSGELVKEFAGVR